MPPRYAYWTILVGDQPTAFRAGSQEDLMPTFKRLQSKHADAKMMWFQNGKLWPSRLDAQEAMRARGEMGRRGDDRQAGFRSRDRSPKPEWRPKGFAAKPEWRPKPQKSEAEGRGPRRSAQREGGLDWKPKGEFTPAPKRSERPDWKPKGSFDRKPEWKPKGSFDRERKPRGTNVGANFSSPRGERKPRGEKLEWRPKGEGAPAEKRKWIPKEEYKKSLGIEAKRDSKWRPGGEHKDPRQKYKDAKKAKWSKFKQNIRQKWEKKAGKKSDK